MATPSSASAGARSQRLFLLLGAVWIVFGVVLLALDWVRPNVRITWTTETEIDTAGFNIYRADAPDGGACAGVSAESYRRLNDTLIPGSGDPISGGEYSYSDTTVAANQTYCYVLEDVELSQATTRHTPIVGSARIDAVTIAVAAISIVVGIGLIISGLRMEKTL